MVTVGLLLEVVEGFLPMVVDWSMKVRNSMINEGVWLVDR